MQALKALVIIMGVLIVLGTTVVVVTIYNRLNPGDDAPPPPRATEAAEPGLAAFGEAEIAIPGGCAVAQMLPHGERLLLRLAGPAGCDRILVVELATGRPLGDLRLVPGP